jgi:competence protein ComEC
MKQPLFRVVLLFASGILLSDSISLSLPVLLGGALGLAVLTLLWPRARPALLYPLILLAGWANHTVHTAVLSPHDLRRILGEQPQLVTIRAELRETPSLRVYEQDGQPTWRALARVDVRELCINKQSWRPAVGRMAVTTKGVLTNVYGGQWVEISGVAARPRIAAAEGTFDYRAYLEQQGIYYQLQAGDEDWKVLRSPVGRPLADRFGEWARRTLARGLPVEDESLRLEWALALGWKPALMEEVTEPFVRAATYHIFAVDGLRMAIVFGIFFTLLRVLRLPRSLCGVILIPLIWFYVALTGWPASAIRATVMLTVVIVGWAMKRPGNALNSLFAAAFIILLWEPQQLFQAGFQLSFVVVLCLILMLPPLYKTVERWTAPDPLLPRALHRRWPPVVLLPTRYCVDLLLTSFAAWVGSIPLVAYYFHIVTPVSTPANLLAVPLCGLVLISNLTSLLLASWFPAAAELFNHAGWFLMESIRVTSVWFANWPRAYCYVATPGLFGSGLYYALLLAILTGGLFRPARRGWRWAAVGAALSLWLVTLWHASAATRLTVLAVNGGSAIYCDAPGTRNDLLIDAGTTNSVQFATKSFLRAQGVNRLPALLLTHGDLHHVGGAQLIASLFPLEQICVSPVRFRSATYRAALRHFNEKPDLVRFIKREDALGAWAVLHPEATDRFSRADDNAVVLRGTFGGTRVLLLSDLGRTGQDVLLERCPDLGADIVVTGLPSTGEPLCEALLDAVQPRVIIVADSEFPLSERASPTLRARLARRQVPVIYTRSAGVATIEFRGRRWEIKTMSGERLESSHVAVLAPTRQPEPLLEPESRPSVD